MVLRPRDLVPIVSFIARRGRCSSCPAPIAPSHIVTELLGGAIGIAAGWAAPGVAGVAGAVFGWLLLSAAAIDLAAFWLPNVVTAAVAAAGVTSGLAGLAPSMSDRLIGGAAGFGVLWIVAAAYRRARGRTGLGGGDPKLFGAIGLWLGWRALPVVMLAACMIGFTVVLVRRARGRPIRPTDRLPLGTLLAAAAFAAWLVAR